MTSMYERYDGMKRINSCSLKCINTALKFINTNELDMFNIKNLQKVMNKFVNIIKTIYMDNLQLYINNTYNDIMTQRFKISF